jgi:hypothetical protein
VTQPGTRSNAGTPGGRWWNDCLSIVKIAICGEPKMLGSSKVRAELARDRLLEVLAAESLRAALGVLEAGARHRHDHVRVSAREILALAAVALTLEQRLAHRLVAKRTAVASTLDLHRHPPRA